MFSPVSLALTLGNAVLSVPVLGNAAQRTVEAVRRAFWKEQIEAAAPHRECTFQEIDEDGVLVDVTVRSEGEVEVVPSPNVLPEHAVVAPELGVWREETLGPQRPRKSRVLDFLFQSARPSRTEAVYGSGPKVAHTFVADALRAHGIGALDIQGVMWEVPRGETAKQEWLKSLVKYLFNKVVIGNAKQLVVLTEVLSQIFKIYLRKKVEEALKQNHPTLNPVFQANRITLSSLRVEKGRPLRVTAELAGSLTHWTDENLDLQELPLQNYHGIAEINLDADTLKYSVQIS